METSAGVPRTQPTEHRFTSSAPPKSRQQECIDPPVGLNDHARRPGHPENHPLSAGNLHYATMSCSRLERMRITRLKVETFKSLYDVECEFGKFNVITGPNASGKSNLVDALRFLGDTYTHGLEFAVSRAGGIENIAHRRTRRAKKAIGFSVTGIITFDDLRHFWYLESEERKVLQESGAWLVAEHSFRFKTSAQTVRADYVIEEERFTLRDEDGRPIAELTRNQDGFDTVLYPRRKTIWRKSLIASVIRPFGDPSIKEWFKARGTQTELFLAEGAFPGSAVGGFTRYLGQIGVFQLSPHLSRTPGVPTPNAQLELHGENLPGAAYNLMRSSGPEWSQVQEAMRMLLPNLESIEIANTEDRRLALQFRESGVGRAWTSGEVSDGTIQSLALLVALFDPRTPLLVIEEPENAVHPWILRNFVDLCRLTDKQLILTSHSPILLNYVGPEVIQLMWMRLGRSTIRPLLQIDADAAEAVVSGEISVFDLYDSGLLPQAVPRGLGGLEDAE